MFFCAAPGDYTAISEDLTFSASETRICRDVISADDDILEEDEDLLLTLTTTDDTVTLRPNEATVTILNDDSRSNLMRIVKSSDFTQIFPLSCDHWL